MSKPQKVHFVGICGVAMSAVATALWSKGYKVTGSDSGFFPPVSTHLSNLGIPYYPGFHPEKMVASNGGAHEDAGGAPDLLIVGNAMATKNPEVEYARKHGITIKSYPEAVGEFIVKPHSIVCTGTYGKTTSSALLSHILKHANLKPSYMIGGVTQDGAPSAAIDNGEWSVVEGDEYTSAKWDKRAKFMHYKPTHLLMTAVKWDHADVYPTEQSYFDAFKNLIKMMPAGKATAATNKKSLIVACTDTETLPALLADSGREYISYGKNDKAEYRYQNVHETKDGLNFEISYHGKEYQITSPLLGAYNAENITGCFAMAKEIGIAPGDISDAIKSFRGIKRRLEKRYEHNITVIDDIAHSPEKARSVLKTLRDIYDPARTFNTSIIAIYEPNTGNRTIQSISAYKGAFSDASAVIIPRLTKLKVDESIDPTERPFDGQKLTQVIIDGHESDKPSVQYIEDDEALVKFITTSSKDGAGTKDGDVIVFLGSHGFRGMIEETVKNIAGV